jgi:hypothetical protein
VCSLSDAQDGAGSLQVGETLVAVVKRIVSGAAGACVRLCALTAGEMVYNNYSYISC